MLRSRTKSDIDVDSIAAESVEYTAKTADARFEIACELVIVEELTNCGSLLSERGKQHVQLTYGGVSACNNVGAIADERFKISARAVESVKELLDSRAVLFDERSYL